MEAKLSFVFVLTLSLFCPLFFKEHRKGGGLLRGRVYRAKRVDGHGHGGSKEVFIEGVECFQNLEKDAAMRI